MPLDVARDLSLSELFRVLNEKLDLECTRLQESRLSAAETESEVSNALISTDVATGSDGRRFNPPAQHP